MSLESDVITGAATSALASPSTVAGSTIPTMLTATSVATSTMSSATSMWSESAPLHAAAHMAVQVEVQVALYRSGLQSCSARIPQDSHLAALEVSFGTLHGAAGTLSGPLVSLGHPALSPTHGNVSSGCYPLCTPRRPPSPPSMAIPQ